VTVLRHGAALLVGVLVAIGAVTVHRSAYPLGLLLAVATTYAVPWWLLRSPHPRTASSYVLGWLAAFAVVVAGRPEGDYALAQDVRGYALMLAGLGLVVVGVVAFTGGRRSNT
jgi:Family of unknown function (DUF6113)